MRAIVRRTVAGAAAVTAALLPAVFGGTPADAQAAPEQDRPSTWTVVALDPATGDVGVAGASCVSGNIDALASLVPGRGVAATQAWYQTENRDRVQELLVGGSTAGDIIAQVTASDDDAAERQYGVISLADGRADIAAFTGDRNDDRAGSADSQAVFPVTVQGNILEGERVVADALAAFDTGDVGDLALSDRLLRALEAGSAAGGDKRCNENGVRQTASSAFLLVARGDEAPFVVTEIGDAATTQPGAPALALSVAEPMSGPNPLVSLHAQYDTWRAENLPACADCDLAAIEVPVGGDAETAAAYGEGLLWMLGGLALALIAVVAAVVVLVVWLVRRRGR